LARSAVGQDIRQAALFLEISRLLAEQSAGKLNSDWEKSLLAAQERFYRYCEFAEHRPVPPNSENNANADETDPRERLQKLQQTNKELAQSHDFETIRLQAEHSVNGLTVRSLPWERSESSGELKGLHCADNRKGYFLSEQGTPTYWQPAEGNTPFRLQLKALRVEEDQHRLGISSLLIVLLLIAWLLSHFPRTVAWLQSLWPEQVCLLAVLGRQIVGHQPVFVVLVFFGVCARLILLTRWGLSIMRSSPSSLANRGQSAS
jgi:hypothetical protein